MKKHKNLISTAGGQTLVLPESMNVARVRPNFEPDLAEFKNQDEMAAPDFMNLPKARPNFEVSFPKPSPPHTPNGSTIGNQIYRCRKNSVSEFHFSLCAGAPGNLRTRPAFKPGPLVDSADTDSGDLLQFIFYS